MSLMSKHSAHQLIQLFPKLLDAALYADKPVDWQRHAIICLSLWVFKVKSHAEVKEISQTISPKQWNILSSFVWTRWGTAPPHMIQKILKELHTRVRALQSQTFDDWKQREIKLLESLFNTTIEMDPRVLLFLLEDLLPIPPRSEPVPFQMNELWMGEWVRRTKDQGLSHAISRC